MTVSARRADPPRPYRGLLEGPWAAKILRVIAKEQVVPLLLEACPSFGEQWTRSIADAVYEEGLLYVDLGEFAHHLVELVRAGTTSEFVAVFDVVERLHVDGDSYVKEAVTIGLLEGLQNVAGNKGVDPQRFAPWLKPESAKWWADELNDFWDGKVPYVGAGLTRKQT